MVEQYKKRNRKLLRAVKAEVEARLMRDGGSAPKFEVRKRDHLNQEFDQLEGQLPPDIHVLALGVSRAVEPKFRLFIGYGHAKPDPQDLLARFLPDLVRIVIESGGPAPTLQPEHRAYRALIQSLRPLELSSDPTERLADEYVSWLAALRLLARHRR
jgi:hypothetical protein